MIQLLFHIVAIGLYTVSAVFYWRVLETLPNAGGDLKRAMAFGGLGVVLQGALLIGDIDHDGHLTLGVGTILSLDAWAVAAIFLIASLRKPIGSLGAFIMPSTAIATIGQIFLPASSEDTRISDPWLVAHIVISILAYSLLSIAVVQSLFLWVQESRLRRRYTRQPLRAIPPMETMETLMFEMIQVGFLLLTLTLVSGFFFSEQLFGNPLPFTHHSILSLVAWLAFAVLLIGRRQFGWRGLNAVRWTIGGFVLLVFAYLSAEFLFKLVLPR
ncbi:MAG: cytochrome C assembly family protein [Acidiferrobacter sp.]